MRRKTARLVAAKAVLAARVDASHESTDGKAGTEFLADIEGKLEKLQEPPPVKSAKVFMRRQLLSFPKKKPVRRTSKRSWWVVGSKRIYQK